MARKSAQGKAPEAQATPLEVHGGRIQRIFAMRESDADPNLLLGLIDQTYRQFKDRPGVDEALKLGLQPYLAPSSVDGTSLIAQAGHRAVSFVRKGTLFLIWGGSAASEDDDGNNLFVDYLADLVESLKPGELFASTFSRLVRSQNVQGKLRAKLVGSGTKVHVGSQMLDMATDHGQMVWDILALVYSMERNQIERRLVLGQIFAASKGDWMLTQVKIPGYEVHETPDGARLRLSPNESDIARTRAMIVILASEGTARAKVAKLAELGIERSINLSGGAVSRLIDEAASPYDAIRTLNRYVQFYRDGVYVYRRQIPNVDLVDEVAGFPIQEDAAGRYVEVPMPVPLPEGGWASDLVFEAWDIESRRTLGNPGGSAKKRVKPLTDTCDYISGDHEYRLMSDGRDTYVLRQRPYDPDRTHSGWDAKKHRSVQVAQFDSKRLHASLADGIRTALTSGVNIQLIDAEVALRDDGRAHVVFVDAETRRQHLQARLEELRTKLKRVADLAGQAEAVALANEYHAQGESLALSIEELTSQLEQVPSPAQKPETMVVYGRTIIDALDTLGAVQTTAERQVADAIRTVLSDLCFELEAEEARWTVNVKLPTSSGLAILKGVTGVLPRHCRTSLEAAAAERQAAARRVIDGLCAGLTSEEFLDVPHSFGRPLTTQGLGQSLEKWGAIKELRTHIANHPVIASRQLLTCDLAKRSLPTDFDGAWVELMRKVTPGAANYQPNKAQDWARNRQELIDRIVTAGGTLQTRDLSEQAPDLSQDRIRLLLGYRAPQAGSTVPVAHPGHPQLVTACDGDRFALTSCNICGTLDWEVVRVPEYTGLLCRACEHAGSVQFPPSYLGWQVALPLASALYRRTRGDAALMEGLPDGQFTIAEWVAATGKTAAGLQWTRDRLIERSQIIEVGPDPRHKGLGMVPTLYSRAPVDEPSTHESA